MFAEAEIIRAGLSREATVRVNLLLAGRGDQCGMSEMHSDKRRYGPATGGKRTFGRRERHGSGSEG